MVDKAVETKVKPRKPKCMQKKTTYVIEYPQMLDFERLQMENYWLPTEPRAENDTHELRTGLTETEYHGVITVLKLFTLYEVSVGVDYWLNRFMRMFPRPEFHRVASINGMTELNIHAPFYNKVNEILKLNTDEFYESYVHDPVLKARMDFIEKACTDKDDLHSLAVFSMIEGAVLYSSFAFMLHFQNNGKNKLGAIAAGLNFSLIDEQTHSMAGATAFRIAISEMIDEEIITDDEKKKLYRKIVRSAKEITEHEYRIIDMIFENGEIEGIKQEDMKVFVQSRVNLCLNNLGIAHIYEISDNPIGKWFYGSINMPTIHDFFVNLGSQYNRDWAEKAFIVPDTYTFKG